MSPAAKNAGSLKTQFSALSEQIPRMQKLLIMTLGIAVLTGAGGMVAIQKPWLEQRRLLLDRRKQEQERSALLAAIQRQAGQLEKQKQTVLLQGGTSILISEVSRLASKSGLQIESVMPKAEVHFGPFTKFQIEVEATSNLQGLLNFLSALERHEPLLKVDRLEAGEMLSEETTRSLGAGGESAPLPAQERQGTTLLISAFSQQAASP